MKTTYRILAQNQYMSNDTHATGLNNNDLIVGPSGAGKTRGYVMPNIMQANESMVIADTKNSLYVTMGGYLRRHGCEVVNIDLTDTLHSDGYNPLDYIRYDHGKYNEQDILTLCAALVPLENSKEPYWERSARTLLASLVGYVLESLPQEEHTLEYVLKLFTAESERQPGSSSPQLVFRELLRQLGAENPDSFAYRQFLLYSMVQGADRTDACILSFLSEKLAPMSYNGPVHMFNNPKRIDFAELGRRKTVVFLNISDTDRSMDGLANVFYTQALHTLCSSADKDYPDHRLPVPVRFILDDFATNARIPDFDKIISVIRSREIYVSIILQSISQLESIYTPSESATIINNCDNCLYLGGQDVQTANYMAAKANKTADTILAMPLDRAYLFTRGQKPREARKFDLRSHQAYHELQGAFAHTGKDADTAWNDGPGEEATPC